MDTQTIIAICLVIIAVAAALFTLQMLSGWWDTFIGRGKSADSRDLISLQSEYVGELHSQLVGMADMLTHVSNTKTGPTADSTEPSDAEPPATEE